MISVPGIYNISHADYHADPCPTPSLSSSIANVMLRQSPAHAAAQHPRLNPAYVPDESSRFDLGSMAHALLLEGDGDKMFVVDADDWRTKHARELRDEARAASKLPVLRKHSDVLTEMVGKAKTFLAGSEVANEAWLAERTCIWQEGGIWCRSRPDWLGTSVVLDYKTTDDAAPDAFIRQIARMGYDFQAAFYSRGIEATSGNLPTFVFLAQEIEPPYACSLVALSNAFLEIAKSKVERAIKTWQFCLARGEWPAYSNKIHYAEPPAWLMADFEARQAFEMGEWK